MTNDVFSGLGAGLSGRILTGAAPPPPKVQEGEVVQGAAQTPSDTYEVTATLPSGARFVARTTTSETPDQVDPGRLETLLDDQTPQFIPAPGSGDAQAHYSSGRIDVNTGAVELEKTISQSESGQRESLNQEIRPDGGTSLTWVKEGGGYPYYAFGATMDPQGKVHGDQVVSVDPEGKGVVVHAGDADLALGWLVNPKTFQKRDPSTGQ